MSSLPSNASDIAGDDSNVVDLAAAADGRADAGLEKKSVATQLVALALREYRLGRTPDDRLFAYREGSHIVRMFTGGHISMRSELAGLFYKQKRRTASDTALKEALNVLEYKASKMEPAEVYLRSATRDGELWIDLGDERERAIHVTPGGYEVVDSNVPIFFERTRLTLAFPEPESGGDLEQLWDFVNVKGDDRELIYGWMVAALVLVGRPCPALGLLGEQGTAKTSATRTLGSMVDPSAVPVRKRPKDEEAWIHALNGSRSAGFDNLSNMPPWLSDSICRAVTGDADVNRKYFTDDNIRILKAQRVILFNGIDIGVPRGDLAERTIWGELEVIPKTERKSERVLDAAWSEVRPAIFGALVDLISKVLRELPSIHLAEAPRMADFAEVLAAMDAATGSKSLQHYMGAQESSSHDIVEGDKFLSHLSSFVGEQDDRAWQGTSKDLYIQMPAPEFGHRHHDKYWPASSTGYTNKIKRCAPALRAVGWVVEKTDGKRNQASTWRLVTPEPADDLTDPTTLQQSSATRIDVYFDNKPGKLEDLPADDLADDDLPASDLPDGDRVLMARVRSARNDVVNHVPLDHRGEMTDQQLLHALNDELSAQDGEPLLASAGLAARGNLTYSVGYGYQNASLTPDSGLGDGLEFTKEQLLQALRHEQPVAGITYMG